MRVDTPRTSRALTSGLPNWRGQTAGGLRRLWAMFVVVALALGVLAVPADATNSPSELEAEREFLRYINDHRSAEGLAPLDVYWDLVDDAREHSVFQAEGGCADGARICHNLELASVTDGWHALGENVGVGYDVAGLDRAFWESDGHRANVLGNYNYAGVGVHIRDDATMYVTVVFMRGPDGLPATVPGEQIETVRRTPYEFPNGADRLVTLNPWGRWTVAGEEFFYGDPGDMPLFCDWDGDGVASVGLYRPISGFLYLRNTNDFGVADISVYYGLRSDLPVCGDWDGDGVDTIGVYRPVEGRFYLRNTNDLGFADVEVDLGKPDDIPLSGDWFGTGRDSVGVFRPETGILYLADERGDASQIVAVPRYDIFDSDHLVVGDWDADGIDTIGIVRPTSEIVWLSAGLGADTPLGYVGISPIPRLHLVAGRF